MENIYELTEQFSCEVENIVEKGEIVLYEHFHLLTQCFQKYSATEVWENICIQEMVKYILDNKYFYRICSTRLLKTMRRRKNCS